MFFIVFTFLLYLLLGSTHDSLQIRFAFSAPIRLLDVVVAVAADSVVSQGMTDTPKKPLALDR